MGVTGHAGGAGAPEPGRTAACRFNSAREPLITYSNAVHHFCALRKRSRLQDPGTASGQSRGLSVGRAGLRGSGDPPAAPCRLGVHWGAPHPLPRGRTRGCWGHTLPRWTRGGEGGGAGLGSGCCTGRVKTAGVFWVENTAFLLIW